MKFYAKGQILRYNPIIRGGSLLYLLILHLWAFFSFIFHAHMYEALHGDYGDKAEHIGVGSMIQHSYRVQEQLPRQP